MPFSVFGCGGEPKAGGRGGGGVLGISSDGDDLMEPKVKTQKKL